MRNRVKVIAEMGCNHQGDIEKAKKLIELAYLSNAWAIKGQKRTPKELLTEEQYNKPHPVPFNSYGDNYGQHREFLEFSIDQHKELMDYAKTWGIIYTCSVWDKTSAREFLSLNPEFIKIGSPSNLNFEIYSEIEKADYSGDIHISLGMTEPRERYRIFSYLKENCYSNNFVFYCCTSDYPVAFKNICLMDISVISEELQQHNLKYDLGFSGHHLGIAVDIAAYTLGAEYIERHFTIDRTLKGTDHAASLEPSGLKKLVRDLEAVKDALRYKIIDKGESVLQCEKTHRKKLKLIKKPY